MRRFAVDGEAGSRIGSALRSKILYQSMMLSAGYRFKKVRSGHAATPCYAGKDFCGKMLDGLWRFERVWARIEGR